VRTSIVTLIHLLVLAGTILIVVSAAQAQTDPPANGDWTVSDRTVVVNQTVRLHGNLTVETGGYLTLRNVTLQVFSGVGNTRGITVKTSGTLEIDDMDGRSTTEGDRSVVMRGNPSQGYYFIVDAGSDLSINRSLISGMGSVRSNDGLLVRADDVRFRSTTFIDGEGYNVKFEGSNGSSVVDCTFYLSDYGLVAEDCENLTVDFSVFLLNDRTGLRIVDSSHTTIVNVESAENSQSGIVLDGAYNTSIIDTEVYGNIRGMILYSVRQLDAYNVQINDSNFEGILIEPGCQDINLDLMDVFDCFRSGLEGEAVRNLTIVDSDFYRLTYYGIRLLNGSENIVFDDVRVNNSGYDGIHIERAVGVLMRGCVIANNSYNGVFLIDTKNVTLYSNYMGLNAYDGFNCDNTRNLTMERGSFVWNGYNGISIQAGSNEVALIDWPMMMNNTRSGLGIDSAMNISVTAIFVGNGDYGARIESGASNVSLNRCLLDNNTNGAMRIEESWNVRMDRSTVNQYAVSTYMLSVRDAGDVWVMNSTVAGIVNVSNGGNATVVNSTFEDLTPDVEASSWLDYAHWAFVEVVWPNLLPVVGASVNATSNGGIVLAEAVTNATGIAGPMAVAFNRFVGDSIIDNNPVTFWAQKGNEIARTPITVLDTVFVRIVLADDLPPVAVAMDIVAELGEKTTLNGSLSHDNGQVVSWIWTFDDGVGIVVLDGRIVNWTFAVLGNYTGQLNVTDMVRLSNRR
jgi:parallel beta-helix repeat protein